MKYEEYVEKHKKVIKPVNNFAPLLNFLSILQMIGDEIGGDFSERVDKFCENERNIILKTEIKESK